MEARSVKIFEHSEHAGVWAGTKAAEAWNAVAMMPSDGHTCYSYSICKIKRRRERERAREGEKRARPYHTMHVRDGRILGTQYLFLSFSSRRNFISSLLFCCLGWRKMGCFEQARAITSYYRFHIKSNASHC